MKSLYRFFFRNQGLMRKITQAHKTAKSMLKRAMPYLPPPVLAGKRKRKNKTKKTPRELVFVKKGDPGWNQFRRLVEQVKQNTSRALEELQDELRRLNGKVVSRDYPPNVKHRVMNADGTVEYVNYYEMYCLDPKIIAERMVKEQRAREKEEKRKRKLILANK